jgi:hypothetical protein
MADRRRKLTDKEKAAILARQGGKCPGLPNRGIECGVPITAKTCVFDHIDQRVFTGSDEPDTFQALCTQGGRTSCNSIKTYGSPATSAGSDANKRAKVRRAQGLNKPRRKQKIPSRPFPEGNRKIMSRNDLRGRR